MRQSLMILLWILFVALPVQAERDVRNSQFGGGAGVKPTDEQIATLREAGWTCPDAKQWPNAWGGQGADVEVSFPQTGGHGVGPFCRLSGGNNGYLNGYWGFPFEDTQILEVWAKGNGILRVGLMAYKLSDDHSMILPGGQMPTLDIKIKTDKWVRYRYLMRKPDYELTGHPLFMAPEGTVDIDDVKILSSNRAFDLIVAEENTLYGKDALSEDTELIHFDENARSALSKFDTAVMEFENRADELPIAITKPMRNEIKSLTPYLHSDGIKTVATVHFNQMLVLTRVLQRLAGNELKDIDGISVIGVDSEITASHYPGKRFARAGKLTITNLRSNKVRYSENEAASTEATLTNETNKAITGTIVATMILGLDSRRELARVGDFSIESGESKKWRFNYNVGPETYGRAIEVEFLDGAGNSIDRWQEYYGVAEEFFRIHQHCYQTKSEYWDEDHFTFYYNQSHYFAHEPTALGMVPFDAEQYIAGQVGYRISVPLRKAQIARNKQIGVATTFYSIGCFDSQMGYEQVRKHPEFILYDANGQPAVDPLYGGYPNPMELASPIEVGPKRKELSIKPHLDREITPWQHVNMNFAREDAVRFAVEHMKTYSDHWGFDGVYFDGCLGVWSGYAYDGVKNVPSGKYEDFVKLGARNHQIFNEVLKRENKNYGTWLNWGLEGATGDFAKRHGITIWLGSGVDGDPLDDNVRAATTGRNVMLLDEISSFQGHSYSKLESDRVASRDHYVQKYGANHIIGYASTVVGTGEPGVSNWGWPTWNYVQAILTATQSHLASHFIPSHRPQLQFTTRYSQYVWARDVKVVAPPKAEGLIKVDTGVEEAKLRWRNFVYERDVDSGREIIVHLVQTPPTDMVDYQWADEPDPIEGVSVSLNTAGLDVSSAIACRPYHFEEPQQVVQTDLEIELVENTAKVHVPPFRYHTMLVFRVADNE